MVKSLTYKRLFAAVILISALLFIVNGLKSNKGTSVDVADLPENHFTMDGYVVSKRMNTIWVADERVSIWRRVVGYVTSDYGKGSVIVSRHEDAEDRNLFHGLKINQRVRIYGDNLKESFPGKTSAYYIELISGD